MSHQSAWYGQSVKEPDILRRRHITVAPLVTHNIPRVRFPSQPRTPVSAVRDRPIDTIYELHPWEPLPSI